MPRQTIPRFYGGEVTAAAREVDVIDVSFEAGETTTYKVQVPAATTITGFYASVTKALAGTDAGTIALVDNAGTTQATISFPASSALTTESTQNPVRFRFLPFHRTNREHAAARQAHHGSGWRFHRRSLRAGAAAG